MWQNPMVKRQTLPKGTYTPTEVQDRWQGEGEDINGKNHIINICNCV